MIDHKRERELALQIARFLEGELEFPADLTEEDVSFVDRLIAVQETLLAIPHRLALLPETVALVESKAGVPKSDNPTTTEIEFPSDCRNVSERPEIRDPSRETRDQGTETANGQ